MNTLDRILENKIIAILRGLSEEEILRTGEALLKGGVSSIEVTFNFAGDLEATPRAIAALRRAFGNDLCAGAGTVLTTETVQLAADAGAQYIITPNTDEAVIRKTKELGLIAMPGAMTPTEVVQAHRFGADIVKIFPSGDLGPGYIKALKGPLGFIPMAAVGGIDEHNIAAYLKAGACCAGVGGKLANLAAIRSGAFASIEACAKALVTAAQEATA